MSVRKSFVRQLIDDRWLIAVVVLVELAAMLSLTAAAQTTFQCVQDGVPVGGSDRGLCDVVITTTAVAVMVTVALASVLLTPLLSWEVISDQR